MKKRNKIDKGLEKLKNHEVKGRLVAVLKNISFLGNKGREVETNLSSKMK